jgi:hypothetical protein
MSQYLHKLCLVVIVIIVFVVVDASAVLISGVYVSELWPLSGSI